MKFPVAGKGPDRRRTASIFAAVVLLVVASCASAPPAVPAGYPDPAPVTGDAHSHDPSMVRTSGGTYYLYSTHNLVEMRSSKDRVAFSRVGSAFSGPLSWPAGLGLTTTDIWAPDVSFHHGSYWMYYAVSSFGSNNSAIGLATSVSGAPNSWQDRGMVYESTSSSDYNAIDPNLVVDSTGKWWLAFGSFWSGVKLIELDPSTGKQLGSNPTRYDLASRPSPDAEEAPFIWQANGWFYLFLSWDHCCQGPASDYRTMVGRSRTVTGGYVDKNGTALTAGGGSEVVASHGSVHGPGGESVLHDADGDMLVYHWYDDHTENPCQCELGLDHLADDGDAWPFIH